MKRFTIIAPVIVLLALVVVCTPALAQTPTSAASGKIISAYIGPLTGPAASWGQSTSRGGKYFLDQANAKGGVKVGGKTYTFELINYDHGLDPAKAVEYAKRAIASDKVNLLVLQSTLCALATMPIVTENKIVNFHMSMGRKIMSPNFRYSFRACPTSLWGEAAAFGYLKNNLGLKTVVSVLADDESGWEAFGEMKEAAEITGINILENEYYIRGTKDFFPVLSRALAKKPEIISYGSSSPGDCYLIIKQAYELGFKGMLTGSSPLDIAQLKKMVPEKTLDNILLVTLGTPDVPEYLTPEEQEMKKAMIEKYGRDGKLWDITMDSTWQECCWAPIYIQAIQKADSLDPEKLTKVIETSTFPVLGRQIRFIGEKQFGINHQLLCDVPVMRIVNGVPKVVGMYKAGDTK